MAHKLKSGDGSPPIYEKDRALRMARKLGLRIISSRTHKTPPKGASPAVQEERCNLVIMPERKSGGLGQGFQLPLTSESTS